MRCKVAKTAGFCYGVRRAVDLATDLAHSGKPCVMLGHIIHNESVIAQLADLGVSVVNTPEEVPDGVTVILRSHGESRRIHEVLRERNIEIMDTTCPNVSHIHQIAQKAEGEGRKVLIIGETEHPEVQAIAGWCQSAEVLKCVQEVDNWLKEEPNRVNLPITVVSQTTSMREVWEKAAEKIKKECTNLKTFDTICNATCKRQIEAKELAAQCDAMIVVGGRASSNTRRLYELCLANCPQVLWVSRGSELEPSALCGKASVGITAGASTPGWIIKEVYDKMSDEIMEIEESFAELLEKSIKTLHTGEKVTGVVIRITSTEIQVDLGTKHAGYIPASELTDDPTVKIEDMVKVGDEIETYVMRVNDQEGMVTLSKKRLDSVKSWEDIEKAKEDNTTMEGIVTEENKGGIVVSIKGVRVFVPASQTGLPREAAMSEIMKKKVRLRITEVNRARRRVVGSIRAVSAEERAAKAVAVWENIEEGKRYDGTVKSLTSYGAFVDIGGVDGMVHISELSWSRIKHPSEVVKVGDPVAVYVISADKEKKKISLGMKDRGQDPWTNFTTKCDVGNIVNVRIVKLMTFGAFAEVVPGVDGLIHISQMADHRVEKPADVVTEGQMVDVKITEIDFDLKKVSLSIRAAVEPAAEDETEVEAEEG